MIGAVTTGLASSHASATSAGGWRIKDGVNPDDHNNWTPDLYGPRGPSKSWSVSGWLRTFGLDFLLEQRWNPSRPPRAPAVEDARQ